VRARLGREGLVAQVWLDYFGRAPGERVYVVHAWVRAFVLPGSCVRCELGQMGEMAREREGASRVLVRLGLRREKSDTSFFVFFFFAGR
jgi:hypothetical protein